MRLFGGSKRKNTVGNRIRKLKGKINRKQKKVSQKKELESLQKKWASMGRY